MHVGKGQLAETSFEPCAACSLAPWRRGDRRNFELQVFQLASVRTEPGKRFVDLAQFGRPRHLLLGRTRCLRFTEGQCFRGRGTRWRTGTHGGCPILIRRLEGAKAIGGRRAALRSKICIESQRIAANIDAKKRGELSLPHATE